MITTDRYTKALLTVIAACLLWLCLGFRVTTTPVAAQSSAPQRVIVPGVGGRRPLPPTPFPTPGPGNNSSGNRPPYRGREGPAFKTFSPGIPGQNRWKRALPTPGGKSPRARGFSPPPPRTQKTGNLEVNPSPPPPKKKGQKHPGGPPPWGGAPPFYPGGEPPPFKKL